MPAVSLFAFPEQLSAYNLVTLLEDKQSLRQISDANMQNLQARDMVSASRSFLVCVFKMLERGTAFAKI